MEQKTIIKLPVNEKYAALASDGAIERAAAALESHNIRVEVFDRGQQAKDRILEMIPKGAEVFTMTSKTLDAIGVQQAINESGEYDSVRNKLNGMDRNTQGREMVKLGAAPQWSLGSVHAVTEDGSVLIASNTGSQIAAEAHAADHVVFVVSTKKIVPNLQEGWNRIEEYSYPLEDERAQHAYGVRSRISKVLWIGYETVPDRITLMFVKEDLGF